MNERFDLIVVGLGAMGAAVTYQAASRGLNVLGIDRYEPPHNMGSSHAETRITRLAVGEGPQYLSFVSRSHELWRRIEAETGDPLLHETGGLIVTEPVLSGDRWQDFANTTHRIGSEGGIATELLEPAEVRRRHPNVLVTDGMNTCFEPTAGLVMCEQAIRSQLTLGARHGATLLTGTMVCAVEPKGNGVLVRTADADFEADHVVMATGPWLPQMTPTAVADRLTVTRQVVFWFEAEDPSAFAAGTMPFVMWVGETDEDYIGVFPTPLGGFPAVKVLGEQFVDTTTPDAVDRTVTAEEAEQFFDTLVAPRIAGLKPNAVRNAVCLYTNTPDDHFLIDRHPSTDRVTMMSPCSGHGFKHSAALGEAVAQRIAEGRSDLDLSPFAAVGSDL